MTLPCKFTFTLADPCDNGAKDDKYYAEYTHDGWYEVTWDNSTNCTSYKHSEVACYVVEGHWKIIEQPKENIVKNSDGLFDEFSFTRDCGTKLKMRKESNGYYSCERQGKEFLPSDAASYWTPEAVLRHIKYWTDIKEIKAEPVKCNGVDAEGKPLNFTEKDLKVFQRMELANGCVLIVVHGNYDDELVGVGKDGRGANSWMPFDVDDCDDWNTVAVYSKNEFQNDVLDASTKGKLIWMSNNHPDIVKAATAKTVKLAEIKEALTKLEAERDKLAKELGE